MNHPIIDMHTHILPDVDDGAPDLDTSLSIARKAHQHGITDIFATPHCFSFIEKRDADAALSAFSSLKDAIHRDGLNIRLWLGCEIMCMERWMERILHLLEIGQFPTLNHTKYVLIEFTSWDIPQEEIMYCIRLLIEHGWIPVMAHVERYADTFSSVSFVETLRDMGCLFQLNLENLLEDPSLSIKSLARQLIESELIDFIGTDVHNMHHRPPKYALELDWLKENCSPEYLEKILYKNVRDYILTE